MAEPKRGVVDGVEWSETESRKELYAFARDLGLPEVNSKTRKDDIVAALVAASDPEPVPDVHVAVSPKALRARWLIRMRRQVRSRKRTVITTHSR